MYFLDDKQKNEDILKIVNHTIREVENLYDIKNMLSKTKKHLLEINQDAATAEVKTERISSVRKSVYNFISLIIINK